MKIYCLSIHNRNFNEYKKLNLIPVGLGNSNFDNKWLNDKSVENISDKNVNFGEYTFHYNIWKNNFINYDNWIGFCSYRRFWIHNDGKKIETFDDLNNSIIREPLKDWEDYEVVLGTPLVFKKIKNLKLIKRNLIEVIKKPSVLFRNNSLKDQFNIFHGSFYLKHAIEFLPQKYQKPFSEYLDGFNLNPYNMFICRNTKILNQFYDEIFPWLFKCEEIFKNNKLDGYDKKRIYGFLAERFMPFWFKKNYRTTTCSITLFEN